jgi:transposase
MVNDFKRMQLALLNSEKIAKSILDAYHVAKVRIRPWKREYDAMSGYFSKKRLVSAQELLKFNQFIKIAA